VSWQLPGWPVTASARDDQGRYYVAVTSENYGPAIMVSDDLADWRQLESAPRYRAEDRGHPEHNRIIRSTDFSGLFAGEGRFVDQVWTLHAAHGAMYAGVSEAGLFVSRDRGDSWEPVSGFNDQPGRDKWEPGFGGLCAHTILSDAANPQRMWVGVSAAGFFRTDDGGKTWARKDDGVSGDAGQCVHHVAHDPANASILYRQEHRGVYRSDDGGDSWRVIEDGLPVAELSDGHVCSFGFPMAMDRASGSVFVVPLDGDNYRFPANGRLAAYRTTDGGAHWEEKAKGLPTNSFESVLRGAMAADQLDPGGIYFGTSSGAIYGSADTGERWAPLAAGLPRIMSVEVYPV
jgi:photosystem II stability/assembly factor-like uncharacterized protein